MRAEEELEYNIKEWTGFGTGYSHRAEKGGEGATSSVVPIDLQG